MISLWCVNSYGHFPSTPVLSTEKQRYCPLREETFFLKIQVDLETQGYSWECSLLMQRMKMSPRCCWGAGAVGAAAPHSPSVRSHTWQH